MAHSGPRIAIVGAGLAGLCAAWELAAAGVIATVFEASDRVGGRVRSDTRGYWDAGQTSEWCGELIDSGHTTIRELAGQFGLTLIDLIAAEPPGSSDSLWFNGQRYSPNRAAIDFSVVRPALAADVEAAGEVSWRSSTRAGLKLDAMTVREWIDTRVPGGTASPLGSLLDTAYTIELTADTDDQSALNIIYSLASQPGDGSFSLFGESDERFRIEGGNEQLPRAIAAELSEPVRFGWRLEAIRVRESDEVVLVFDDSGSRSEIAVDAAVLAIPFAVLRALDLEHAGFDARKRAAIDELGAGHAAKLLLQFSSRVWNVRGPDGAGNGNYYGDTGYLNTWDATRGQPGQPGILVNFTGGRAARRFRPPAPRMDHRDDPLISAYAEQLLTSLEPVFPGLATQWTGKAALSVPALDPNANCAYPYYRPGQYHRFAGYERVRMGNIHFAGDHCSVEFQGYMEGAAREGIRAAREVLAGLRSGDG
jgi:monoamine oxidase